jgi:hypothetical protein
VSKATNRKRRRQFRQQAARAANRIDGLPRTPRGRISEARSVINMRQEMEAQLSKAEMDANTKPARDARVRMYGAEPASADSPHWGSAIGRLYATGRITMDQRLAGELYVRRVTAMWRAIEARDGMPSMLGKLADAPDKSPAPDVEVMSEEAYGDLVKRCASSLCDHAAILAELRDVTRSYGGRDCIRALNHVCFNVGDGEVTEGWLGPFREACNLIHKRFIA